jgi:energy-coupling factor transporter ATP-binding protein EcfA2
VPYPLALRASALLSVCGRWPGPLAADPEQMERALGAQGPGKGVAPRSATGPARRGPAVLAMNQAAWSPGGAPVVRDLNLEVARGEIVAVIGRSGTGKTTLLKLAAGLLEPTEGTVHRERPTVPRVRPVALALEYPERQLFGRTVLEDVAALLWVEGIPAEERGRSARRAMVEVGLDPDRFAERFPVSLSEGEKRRAALAGVLVEPPQLLLLDEPTAGLDPEGRRTLAAAVAALRERGRTVLLASHDLAFVAAVADRVLILRRDEGDCGRILAEGPAADLLRDARTLDRAGIPEPDFIRLEGVLTRAGLLSASPVRDEDSLLDALARGASAEARPA